MRSVNSLIFAPLFVASFFAGAVNAAPKASQFSCNEALSDGLSYASSRLFVNALTVARNIPDGWQNPENAESLATAVDASEFLPVLQTLDTTLRGGLIAIDPEHHPKEAPKAEEMARVVAILRGILANQIEAEVLATGVLSYQQLHFYSEYYARYLWSASALAEANLEFDPTEGHVFGRPFAEFDPRNQEHLGELFVRLGNRVIQDLRRDVFQKLPFMVFVPTFREPSPAEIIRTAGQPIVYSKLSAPMSGQVDDQYLASRSEVSIYVPSSDATLQVLNEFADHTTSQWMEFRRDSDQILGNFSGDDRMLAQIFLAHFALTQRREGGGLSKTELASRLRLLTENKEDTEYVSLQRDLNNLSRVFAKILESVQSP